MATLKGLSFTKLNITPVFLIGILLSLTFVLIGNKLNHLIKILLLSFIFSILYFYLNEASPYWYIFGVFLITLFFTNKHKKYSMQSLHCLLYTSPSPRDRTRSRMPSSA